MLGKHAILGVLGLCFLLPLLWMVLTALKTPSQIVTYPPVLVPHPVLLSNFPQALQSEPFLTYLKNTLVYALATMVGVGLSSSLVAYGFSQVNWRGRDILFYVMLSTMLLPFLVTLIPLFVIYKDLGWVGSYLPLIVPTFFGYSVFSTFLLRQFFMTVPGELRDAARLDGASELYVYARIVMPLAKPAVGAVLMFQFIYCWNDFLGPLIYVNKASEYPLSIGLYEMVGTYTTNWGWLMAASTAFTVPIVILFFVFQRYFIQGVAISGASAT